MNSNCQSAWINLEQSSLSALSISSLILSFYQYVCLYVLHHVANISPHFSVAWFVCQFPPDNRDAFWVAGYTFISAPFFDCYSTWQTTFLQGALVDTPVKSIIYTWYDRQEANPCPPSSLSNNFDALITTVSDRPSPIGVWFLPLHWCSRTLVVNYTLY